LKGILQMRFIQRTIVGAFSVLALLMAFSSVVADNSIPAPAAQFTFDSNDSRLEIEGGKAELLSIGSVEEVKQATRKLLKQMAPMGGHILSSGNTISSSVRGGNFMAMMGIIKEHG
jgi:hypothetical protein